MQGVVAAVGRNTVPQLVEQVMVGQQPGQLTRSVVAAGSGALAQLIEAVAVSQPAGQPQLRHVVPGIGQRTDDLDGLLQPGPVGQPPEKARSDSQLASCRLAWSSPAAASPRSSSARSF